MSVAADPALLVIGRSGQLAMALRRVAPDAICLGRNEINILSADAIAGALDRHEPAAVINAAAFTAVDRAESERDAAMALNARAPGLLATACAARGVSLVHVSTDYVFSGEGGAPYAEDASTSPVNVYGASKEAGERAVADAGGRSAIIRTSWLFSDVGVNFVKTMLALAKKRDEIDVVADQVGRPTSTSDLARACVDMTATLGAGSSGCEVFHFANAGEASWAELAEATMQLAAARGHNPARIRPISTAEFGALARRPRDSRLATGKIEALRRGPARHWRVALGEVVDKLLSPGG